MQLIARANQQLHSSSQSDHRLSDFLQHGSTASSVGSGTQVFVISDFADLDRQSALQLATLARVASLCLLQIVDPLEQQLDGVKGYVGISDGAQQRREFVNADKRNAIAAERKRIGNELTNIALQRNASHLCISTADDPEQVLLDAHAAVSLEANSASTRHRANARSSTRS